MTSTTVQSQVAENCRRVRARIESACVRSGRSADAVRLVAVTKYADLEWIRALVHLGVVDLGESRPQQLVERVPLLPDHVRWHLIGHLQRNKVRAVLPLTALIHSVDSFRLLARIDSLAEELQLSPRVLLEVSVSGEASKNGFAPDELVAGWEAVRHLQHVRVDGLMTMAPATEDAEQARPFFRALRQLRDQLADISPPEITLTELSMGMSGDFEVAIEEGATILRVGSSLFDGLTAT
jgi:hypothetical protein